MYTAFEACQKTLQKNNSKINNELKNLFLYIDKAIDKGLYYISGTGHISQPTSHQLSKLGYNVSNDIYKGNEFYFISWCICDLNKNNSSFNKEMQNNTANNSYYNPRNKTHNRKFPIFRRQRIIR